jgi:predicted ATP-dependent endonuclease of OLD family
MSIKSIEIKNFRSIDHLKINIVELNAFVGKNGSGKSTILKAVEYFYNNLLDMKATNDNFDSNNFYKRKLEIKIEYDLSRIIKFSNGSYLMKLFGFKFSEDYLSDNRFVVKMTQEKNGPINWNIDYDERYIIYNSNPVYFCNTRSISLTNWDEIWNVVGDLVNAKDASEIGTELHTSLKSDKFTNFNNYTKLFEKFLLSNNLSVHEYTKKEMIVNLLQLQLGGKKFISNNQNLDYYSDGTNSQNFILFFSYISFEISKKRLKDVTILLDEPELGLHPRMIDELMERIVQYSKNVNFMIFTHSPRLVAYILRNSGELYNVYLDNSYTKLKKIIKTKEVRYNFIITEREASYLFSDFLLFVEGVTEVELFSNRVIQNLFPFLKRIDVVNTTSNDHILRMILPKNNKVEIPYLVLVDLDKLINFKIQKDKSKCKFSIKSLWYSPLSDSDLINYLKFNYAKKEAKKYLSKFQQIEKFKEKSYRHDNRLKNISGFRNVYKEINDFCLFSNVYGVRTTIEGTIINDNSCKYIEKWRFTKNTELRKHLRKHDKKSRVVLNRMMFLGKTETLKSFGKADFGKEYSFIKNDIVEKNSSWISEFFDYYEQSVLKQKQYLVDKNNLKKVKRFSSDFPELYDIITIIRSKLSDE